jgi:hypothetical protein
MLLPPRLVEPPPPRDPPPLFCAMAGVAMSMALRANAAKNLCVFMVYEGLKSLKVKRG